MADDKTGLDHCRVRGVRWLPSASARASSSVLLSFVGFAAGAFLGTRVGPLLLPKGSASPYAPAFGLIGALLGGAMLASGLEGLGFMLRRTIVVPGVGLLDGVLGAVLGAALALGIVWIVAAVAAQTPGQTQLRADIQRSAILSKLNELLPPSGPVLNALSRLDPLPSITGPSPERRGARTADRPRARRPRGLAQRRARARHRLRARDRGLRLGRRPRSRGHQRARRRGRAGHDGRGRRPRAEPAGAGGRLRSDRRRRRAARARTQPAVAAPSAESRRRHAPARSSAIPRTGPFDGPRRVVSGARRRCSRRTPTARGPCPAC